MLIIDSHVHTGINWGEPIEVLLFEMDFNKVSYVVLTGLIGNPDNTSYLLDCIRRFKGRVRVAGIVDLKAPSKSKWVEDMHRQGMTGLRINLRKAEEWDSEEPHYKLAGELGMVISVIGDAADFASAKFKKLLDNNPKTHFCLEHLLRSPGMVDVLKPPYDVYEDALRCAEWPHTSVKVPGVGEILEKPLILSGYPDKYKYPPHYEMAKEAFGIQRMMWGSNYPPSAQKEGYRNTLESVRNHPIFRNKEDLEWVMGKTAARVWGFPE